MPDFVLGTNITYDTLSISRGDFASKISSEHAIETSGAIKLQNIKFKNKSNLLINGSPPGSSTTISANTQGPVAITETTGLLGEVKIEAGVYLWSDTTANSALYIDADNVTVVNEGHIMGKGGGGGNWDASVGHGIAGEAGGPAIKIASGRTGVSITNGTNGWILGGGGGGSRSSNAGLKSPSYAGGGGGAGGGKGGQSLAHETWNGRGVFTVNGGNGGSIGFSGSNGSASWGGFYGRGGGTGGGGGTSRSTSSGDYVGGGGGGGRVLVGTGGSASGGSSFPNGAAGGTGGNAGGNSSTGACGGGGWGASGGTGNQAGGAGGFAIDDNGNTYTLTNSGTVYGVT